jgi:hypothetical protein
MAETDDFQKWEIIRSIVRFIGAILLSIFLVWFTKDLWGLLGLLVLFNFSNSEPEEIEVKCPKCGHEFDLSDSEG